MKNESREGKHSRDIFSVNVAETSSCCLNREQLRY